MEIKYIENKREQKLSKLVENELKLGYNQIQKLIRNKDIKLNGKRVSKDIDLQVGDKVEVYTFENKIKIIFENDDLVVVFKPRNIETISEQGDDLITKLEKQIGIDLFAVHRLDRNTQGLIIFAKNEKSKESLDKAIKNRELEKFYLAKVVGVPKNAHEELVAYLKKDDKKSMVFVSDEQLPGFEQIKTNYQVFSHDDDFSILEVELVTGKTHQIRAHLSHIGYPILGDEKYGNSEINKKFNKKYQCLCAYKLIFHFEKGDYLSYMNGQKIELNQSEIDFC